MKGIIFNVLEKIVGEQYGEATWDKLIESAGVSGAYTALGSYPDEELFALVGAASKALSLTPDEIVRWFGTNAIAHLAKAYPHFFTPHKDTRSFVLTLNDIIHPEVRKLYPGASVPDFSYHPLGDGRLGVEYSSPKKLCSLAEGLTLGAAKYFGQSATVEQPRCMKRGDSSCMMVWSFGPAGSAG